MANEWRKLWLVAGVTNPEASTARRTAFESRWDTSDGLPAHRCMGKAHRDLQALKIKGHAPVVATPPNDQCDRRRGGGLQFRGRAGARPDQACGRSSSVPTTAVQNSRPAPGPRPTAAPWCGAKGVGLKLPSGPG